jgi:hypothetical protein
MPTAASKVLGRSVGQANDKARQLAYDQAEWPPLRNIEIRDEFAPSVAGARWRQLRKTADKRRKEADQALALAEAGRTTLIEIDQLLDRASRVPAAGAQNPMSDPAFKERFIARLKAKRYSPAEIQQAVERAQSLTGSTVRRGSEDLADVLWARNDEYARSAITALVASYFAAAVSDLNTADTSHSRSAAGVDDWLSATRSELRSHERAVFNALKRRDGVAALLAGETAQLVSESRLWQGAEIAAGVARRRRQNMTAASRGAAQAVAVGNAMRALLRALTMSALVRYHASGGTISASWLDSVKGRTMTSANGAGPKTTVGALLRRHPRVNSQQTVLGTIAEVAIRHKDRKPYSSATLVDADGNELAAAIPKIKVDSGGAAVAGAARARGRWEEDLRWVASGEGLLLGFKQDTKLARKSWPSWLTVEMRPVFRVIAHGLDLETSWDPGRSGAGNPLRYSVWSGIAEGGLRAPRKNDLPTIGN